MSSAEDLPQRLRVIRREIRSEYLQPHDKPWIVGFSGGKDSTLLMQLGRLDGWRGLALGSETTSSVLRKRLWIGCGRGDGDADAVSY